MIAIVTSPAKTEITTELKMNVVSEVDSKAAGQLASVGSVGRKFPLSTSSLRLNETDRR